MAWQCSSELSACGTYNLSPLKVKLPRRKKKRNSPPSFNHQTSEDEYIAIRHDSIRNDSIPHDSILNDSIPHDSIQPFNVNLPWHENKRNSPPSFNYQTSEDEYIEGSHNSIPHDSNPHDSIPHDSNPHDSIPYGSIPHDCIQESSKNEFVSSAFASTPDLPGSETFLCRPSPRPSESPAHNYIYPTALPHSNIHEQESALLIRRARGKLERSPIKDSTRQEGFNRCSLHTVGLTSRSSSPLSTLMTSYLPNMTSYTLTTDSLMTYDSGRHTCDASPIQGEQRQYEESADLFEYKDFSSRGLGSTASQYFNSTTHVPGLTSSTDDVTVQYENRPFDVSVESYQPIGGEFDHFTNS